MIKIYQILSAVFFIALLVYIGRDIYHASEAEKYKNKWEQSEAKIDNLQGRIKANVEADKQKSKLERAMANSKDVNNLRRIPSADILVQLREDPL